MKKYSPGCLCCGTDCTDSCFFPCTGGEDLGDCKLCGIDIQLPEPGDSGNLTPPFPLPPECPTTSKCWACYILFDRHFNQMFFTLPGESCEAWTQLLFWPIGGNDFAIILNAELGTYRPLWACWLATDYNCPYDSLGYPCANSKIAIGPTAGTSVFDFEGLLPFITITGPEWDGSCGKITIEVRYTVFEFDMSYNELPIDPGECADPKYTDFLHVFELEYCDCSELTNPFTYISTTETDSCAGGVADICDFPSAVIRYHRGSPRDEDWRQSECVRCQCFNCEGYDTTQMAFEWSGPTLNGTTVLEQGVFGFFGGSVRSPVCYFTGGTGGTEPCDFAIEVFIRCLPCDKYTATITIRLTESVVQGGFDYSGKTDAFNCGETVVFEEIDSNGKCNLSGHTFQLSFVPT